MGLQRRLFGANNATALSKAIIVKEKELTLFLLHIASHPCLQNSSGLRAKVIKFIYMMFKAFLISLQEMYSKNDNTFF